MEGWPCGLWRAVEALEAVEHLVEGQGWALEVVLAVELLVERQPCGQAWALEAVEPLAHLYGRSRHCGRPV